MKNKTSFRVAIVLICALIIIASMVMEPPAGLTVEGFRCLAVVLCAFILWITQAIPVVITCLLVVTGFYYLGVMSTKEIFANAGGNAVFFLLAGYGLGEALTHTNVAYILLRFIMKWAGRSTQKIIAGFTILTAIISLIVSNATAAIIVTGIAVSVMHAMGDPQAGSSKFLKGLMMCVPMGAMCGGLASPASNSMNVTLLDLMHTASGYEVGFLQWCTIGVPLAIILTAVTAIWIPKAVGSEPLNDEEYAHFQSMFDEIPEKLEPKDIKFLVIIAVMIVLWVSSNWIKSINVTFTALLGLGVMFLPGIDLMTGKDYLKSVKPLGVVMLLAVLPLAAAMTSTGAGQWLVDILFGGFASDTPKIILYAMITIVALVIHLAVPSGSGNAGLSAALMFPVAVSSGLSCGAVALILAAQCGNNFLMPTEAIYSYTFCYDHFSFGDCAKSGSVITIVEFLICIIAIPALATLLGWA